MFAFQIISWCLLMAAVFLAIASHALTVGRQGLELVPAVLAILASFGSSVGGILTAAIGMMGYAHGDDPEAVRSRWRAGYPIWANLAFLLAHLAYLAETRPRY